MTPRDELQKYMPEGFLDSAKVWVYQSNRNLDSREIEEIQEQVDQFTMQWESHGLPVNGFGRVFFGNTIIFIADEEKSGVSGCSTDGMVRVVKSIERQYQINLFDRMLLMFYVKEKYQRLPISQLQYAIDEGYLQSDTPYFDVSVHTYAQLKNHYIVPLSESWMSSQIVI